MAKPTSARARKRTSVGQMSAFADYSLEGILSLPDNVILTSTPGCSDRVEAFLESWANARISSFDIETFCPNTSPNGALDPDKGSIRLIQIAIPGSDGNPHQCLVHSLIGDHELSQELHDAIMALLRMQLLSKTHLVVGHNLGFDLAWTYAKFGFRARFVACTMILSQIIWAGSNCNHNLKEVSQRTLNVSVDKAEQTSDWGSPLLSREQVLYAANDAILTLDLYKALRGLYKAEDLSLQVLKAEMGCVPIYAELNVDGMPVAEREAIAATIAAYKAAYLNAETAFLAVFPGCKITESKRRDPLSGNADPDDPDQAFDWTQLDLDFDHLVDSSLVAAIKATYRIDVCSLDKEGLSELSGLPGIKELGMCRYLKNVLDYLQKMLDLSGKGRIRGGFTQMSRQGRGRSTSSNSKMAPGVNLQNPPAIAKAPASIQALKLPDLRRLFTTDPSGRLALGTNDYSAAHGRIAAQTTQDVAFIASFVDDSVDNHCDVAAAIGRFASFLPQTAATWDSNLILAVHGDPSHPDSQAASRLRSLAKNCFYGWLNGAGITKIRDLIAGSGIPCTQSQAEAVLGALRIRFPQIAEFHAGVKAYCKNPSKITTIQFPYGSCKGRYVPIWGLDGRRVFITVSDGEYGLGASPNAALMALWMSVESTAKKLAMIAAREESFDNPHWNFRIVNDCHDEIVWVAHVDHYADADRAVWTAMTDSLAIFMPDVPSFKKPWKASKPVHSWAECK